MRPTSPPRTGLPEFRPPVVILAGGADKEGSASLEAARRVLKAAFAGKSATLVSGGTDSGIPGLAGELAAAMPRLSVVGYLPRWPSSGARRDRRYGRLRTTPARDFSAAEALLAWSEIIAFGIAPADVALLGWGGGRIAALEYRIALALGARVGLVAGSGRAADELLRDRWWAARPNLEKLAADGRAVRRFLFPRTQPRAGARR